MSRYFNFHFAIRTLGNAQVDETMTCHFCDVTSLKCIKILAKNIIYSFFCQNFGYFCFYPSQCEVRKKVVIKKSNSFQCKLEGGSFLRLDGSILN